MGNQLSPKRIWQISLFVALGLVAVWFLSEDKKVEVPVAEETLNDSENVLDRRPEPQVDASETLRKAQTANFEKAAKELQACFDVDLSVNPNYTDPSMESWQEFLEDMMGDIATRSEEWRNTHITLPNGEKRRIHLEQEFNKNRETVLMLKYFGVDSEDLPIPIELPENQSENPDESFIASLEKEGKVTLFEVAEKWIFNDNTEVTLIEQNQVVNEIEIQRSGKSFKCSSLNLEIGQCDCF